MAGDNIADGEEQPSEPELREVTTTGLALVDYAAVRSVGAAHHEVMEAHVLGVDLRVYAVFRSEHTHRHALDEAGAADSPTAASAARAGVTAAELDQVRATHRSMVAAYWNALANHPERRPEPVRLTRIGDYLVARRAGVPHDEALAFAMQAAVLEPRPNMRDLLLWARCRAAGLSPDALFSLAPKSKTRRLTGPQLELVSAVLFTARSFELPFPDRDELVWLASFGSSRVIAPRQYLDERAAGRSKRGALRLASKRR